MLNSRAAQQSRSSAPFKGDMALASLQIRQAPAGRGDARKG